ncbi:hypothetical protein C7974DRAFT_407853 [Boeremia exigua]|uniref:uncharacterized protein n=1 Tax=Boeremia exigua TaxID=749465 RepID=UPI001E8E58D9|nr:uncharacterized protein C7974DRAFT_407853 [Boeremia exigua]KAH6644151.1 hypothetical protein C7974DRAFT_407853 [Boeremia exigua]
MAEAAPATFEGYRGTPHLGWYDRLDQRYRVRERAEAHRFFKTGRVFAMLWSEAASENLARNGTETTGITICRFGQSVYSQIRRFVVVRVNRDRHFVYALAISTYGGRGAMKNGCDPSEHTIVHLNNVEPYWLPGEVNRGMTKDPISIEPVEQNEEMDPRSRLRCGKIYSIEWNVKLRDIGMVSSHDKTKLMRYYKEGQEKGFDYDEELDLYPQPVAPGYPQTDRGYYGYQ